MYLDEAVTDGTLTLLLGQPWPLTNETCINVAVRVTVAHVDHIQSLDDAESEFRNFVTWLVIPDSALGTILPWIAPSKELRLLLVPLSVPLAGLFANLESWNACYVCVCISSKEWWNCPDLDVQSGCLHTIMVQIFIISEWPVRASMWIWFFNVSYNILNLWQKIT